MKIEDLLGEDLVIAVLQGRTKPAVIQEMAALVARHHPEIAYEALVAALEERERLNSTALGEGVAIPHGKLGGVRKVVAAFGRSPEGVDFQSLDGKPTHLFFLLVAPDDSAGQHLKALARISRLLKDEKFRTRLLAGVDAPELYAIIRDEDSRY